MNTIYIFFDVDGTLIDKDDVIRPFAPEVLTLLGHMSRVAVRVWSGGGVQYAERHTRRIMLRAPQMRVGTPDLTIVPKHSGGVQGLDIRRCFFVDDENMLIEAENAKGAGGYHIPAYESTPMPHDMELCKVYRNFMRFKETFNG